MAGIPLLSAPHKPIGDAQQKEETANDCLLLAFLLASEDLGGQDPSAGQHPKILLTEMPNLLTLAQCDPPTYPIYNDKTSTEFHLLLLELLDSFQTAVEVLCQLSQSNEPYRYPAQFTDAMTDAQVFGYGLLKLARGQAFRMHMENIAPSLKKPDPTNAGAPAPASSAEDPVERPQEEGLEGQGIKGQGPKDEELEALKLLLLPTGDKKGMQKTLPQSYINWLCLMVAHFNAIEIVVQYVTSTSFPYQHISVANLVAPTTSSDLYPWEKLLIDLPLAPSGSTLATSNDQILEFVQKAVDAAVRARDLSVLANGARAEWNKRKLPNFKMPVFRQKISDIRALLKDKTDADAICRVAEFLSELKKWPPKDAKDGESVLTKEHEITQAIQVLCDELNPLPSGTFFFTNLVNLTFKGALHCEACLASLIDNAANDRKYPELLQQLMVSDYAP